MTTEEMIKQLLNDLSTKQQLLGVYQDELARRRAEIENRIKPELDALHDELEPQLTVAQFDVQQAQEAVRLAVLEYGKSVKGDALHAVYTKGKTTWDGAKLDGMAAIIPQLNEAKKIGQPSVSIREVK